MKHLSNEEKANELAKCDCQKHYKGFSMCNTAEFQGKNYCTLKATALKAMEWKDKERKELWRITRNHYQEWAEEQIAKEKQKLIEKACEWLKNNMIGLDMGKYPMYSPNFIFNFRKEMEE